MKKTNKQINPGIKKDFPILKSGLVYLDSASTSQKSSFVIEGIKDFYETMNANTHRGIYDLSENASHAFEKSREKVAKFINANYEEIIFTRGCTEGLNIVANLLSETLQKGDEILISEMEHHSNLIPWQQMCKMRNLKLVVAKIDKNGNLDMADFKRKLNNKTKIVSLSHSSNVLGTINPIKEISKIIRTNESKNKSKIYFVVDGAQFVAHTKLDVKKIDADFYSFSGHKMFAPTGIGILYGKAHLLQKLRPLYYGGGMINEVSFNDFTFAEIPSKFEAGTQNISGAIALGYAIDYMNEIGINNIQKYLQNLTDYAFKELNKIKGVKIYGPKKRCPLISFTIEGVHSHDIAEILNRDKIAVRAGHHCCMPLMKVLNVDSLTRVSFHIYNDKKDVDRLIEGLRKVNKVFEQK